MGRLTVRSRALDNEVEISITDAGAGINPTAQEKIFDPFFTTKALGKGIGQGLAISSLSFETWLQADVVESWFIVITRLRMPRDAIDQSNSTFRKLWNHLSPLVAKDRPQMSAAVCVSRQTRTNLAGSIGQTRKERARPRAVLLMRDEGAKTGRITEAFSNSNDGFSTLRGANIAPRLRSVRARTAKSA
jgi:Histidine kinase-, DNA gyrase B-, and HSP90-like ATPase